MGNQLIDCPWQLVLSWRTLSSGCWSFVYLLLHISLSPISNFGCLFFLGYSSLYFMYISLWLEIYMAGILFGLWLALYWLNYAFWCVQVLNFAAIQFINFVMSVRFVSLRSLSIWRNTLHHVLSINTSSTVFCWCASSTMFCWSVHVPLCSVCYDCSSL